MRSLRFPTLLLVLSSSAACVGDGERIGQQGLPVTALCSVSVLTAGSVKKIDTENDYLPHVIACEHGSTTELATLEAQAIAARTYAYYKVLVEKKSLKDGQGDQVYSCSGRNLEDLAAAQQTRITAAVSQTRGQILTHDGLIIAAFFVAGSKTQNTSCKPSAGERSATEKYVTYNEGKTGSAVTPSSLGSSSSPRNRGCLSQWGAVCLASVKTYDSQQILRFYYGADIVIDGATGSCGAPPPPTCVPKPEICNGKDDDCDGTIDNGDPGGGAVCITTKPGVCALGRSACQGGKLICHETVSPSTERCDGSDDDCDGSVDNVPGGCGSCVPSPERCNGVDDDCDGTIDNGNPQGGQICYTGQSCPVGVTTCTTAGLICKPTPRPEICNNLDDDCNGTVDDVPGGCGQPPQGDGGPTMDGAPRRDGGGTWPPSCVPSPERCNGKDDDCDGFPDDNNPEGGSACTIFGAQQFPGVLACVGGKLRCWPTSPGGSPPPKGSTEPETLVGGCALDAEGIAWPETGVLLVLLLIPAISWRRKRSSK